MLAAQEKAVVQRVFAKFCENAVEPDVIVKMLADLLLVALFLESPAKRDPCSRSSIAVIKEILVYAILFVLLVELQFVFHKRHINDVVMPEAAEVKEI